VTGAGGQLGQEIVDVLDRDAQVEAVAADHRALPVDDVAALEAAFEAVRPDIVIHTAALTNLDRCEEHPDEADAVNAAGTRNVVRAAARAGGAHIVYISTDYVFDGRGTRPYRESDETHPLSVYGQTKLAGERACPPEATIVRTSWVAGRHGANFIRTVLDLGRQRGLLRFVDDQRASPTFTADLAPAVIALAKDRRPGCFHVTNAGTASRFELAKETLAAAGADPSRVRPITTAELDPPRPAVRPAYSVLDNEAFVSAGYEPLRPWPEALASLVAQLIEPAR